MKNILSVLLSGLLSWVVFSCIAPLNIDAQIWKGTGISYTRTIPSHNPGTTGAWVAIDTLSGDWYEWQPIGQTWREMGDRIQFSYVPGAPSWTPNKQRSRFVLNAGDSLYVYQGGWVLLNPSAGASYNTSLTYNKPTLSLTDAGGTLTATIPDTSGSNYTLTFSSDTLRLTDQSGTLKVRIPTGGGGGGTDTSGYNQSLTYINDTLSLTDGGGTLKVEIPQPVFPANLVLFATTASDTVASYRKLVTSLDDPNYDDPAVNVMTGVITTTQIVGRQISAFGLLVGNPGVINVQTIGEIRRTAGSGTADFFFEVYLRNQFGVETLLATSDNTAPVSSASFTEFQATALLNNGAWTLTDRIVIKFYANRLPGGSDPTFEFRFGGTNPVRTTFPVPASLLANVPVVVGVTDVQNGVQGEYLTTDVNGKLDQGSFNAGTGISITGSPDITISNTAPDVTVSLSGGGISSVSGTYPNFTITSTEVDGSATNELQTLSANLDTIKLTNSATSVAIKGAGINTASTSGNTITITGTEVDGSTTNEIQLIDTLAIVSDSLRVSLNNNGAAYSAVNLATYKQTLSIASDKSTLTISNGNTISIPIDTFPIATFGGGSGVARDTAVFSTSSVYGSFFNDGTDTIIVTSMRIGLQGTSPSVVVDVIYNDTLNVTGTKLVTAGSTATNTAGGTSVTSFDQTKIPPGNWVWAKTPTVTTKPTYMSITIIGYRKRKA